MEYKKVWQALGMPEMVPYSQIGTHLVECCACGTTKCEHDRVMVMDNGKLACDAVCATESMRLDSQY
jgi:hypothetical protein